MIKKYPVILSFLLTVPVVFLAYRHFDDTYIHVTPDMPLDNKVIAKAIRAGNTELVTLALKRGYSANMVIHSRTILNYTIWTGFNNKLDMMELLIKNGADVNARPLYKWEERNSKGEMVQKSYQNRTPLMEAASIPDPSAVSVLLAAGADTSKFDDSGNSVFSYIAGDPPESDICETLALLVATNANTKLVDERVKKCGIE